MKVASGAYHKKEHLLSRDEDKKKKNNNKEKKKKRTIDKEQNAATSLNSYRNVPEIRCKQTNIPALLWSSSSFVFNLCGQNEAEAWASHNNIHTCTYKLCAAFQKPGCFRHTYLHMLEQTNKQTKKKKRRQKTQQNNRENGVYVIKTIGAIIVSLRLDTFVSL